MKELILYRKIVRGRFVNEDYNQWKKRKKDEIDNMEEYSLRNMRRYYEYKMECVGGADCFDVFQNNFFYIMGIVLTMMVTLIISLGGNVINSFINLSVIEGNEEDMISVVNTAYLELINLGQDTLVKMTIVLLVLMTLIFVINYVIHKKSVLDRMYYEDLLSMINEKLIS